MSTICPSCRGKARVVETRAKPSRIIFKGKRSRSQTVVRLRECPKCRYRWKTCEVPYEALLNRRKPGPWNTPRGNIE